MAKLINGNGNPAIYAAEDADLIASLVGNVTCISNVGNKYAATEEDATTIRLDDGVIITKEGRRIQLEAGESDTFYIPTGTSGQTNYYIIGYKLVQNADSTQVAEQFVQKMNSSSETITEDTFRSGATEVYVSVYRVTQVGFTIDSVDRLLPELLDSASINEDIEQINSDLSNKQDKLTNPLTRSNIINNLTSSSSTDVLSAAQGKVLNDAMTYRYDFINSSNTLADMVSQMISKKLKMMPFSVWTSSSEFPYPYGNGICIRGYDGAAHTIFYNVVGLNGYRAYSGMYIATDNTVTWRRIDVGSCKVSTNVTIPTTATGTSYTAPTDGYLEICTHTSSGVNNVGYVQRGNAIYTISREGAANSTKLTTIVPLTKGETVTLYAQASVVIDSCKFWG